jgi:hypothetical protein
MLLGVSLHEILWLALALVIGGMISGVLAGLFGVSGGSVIVPVLYEAFRVLGVPEDVRMQLCLGTSIAIVVPTTIRSYLTHRSKGAVIPRDSAMGVACGDRRCLQRGDCELRAGGRADGRVRTGRKLHRAQASVRR